jgi:hypothetical protein
MMIWKKKKKVDLFNFLWALGTLVFLLGKNVWAWCQSCTRWVNIWSSKAALHDFMHVCIRYDLCFYKVCVQEFFFAQLYIYTSVSWIRVYTKLCVHMHPNLFFCIIYLNNLHLEKEKWNKPKSNMYTFSFDWIENLCF